MKSTVHAIDPSTPKSWKKPLLTLALGTLTVTAALAGDPKPTAPAPAPVADGNVEIVLPATAGTGAPKEIAPVLDNAHLKLATIVLRKGTLLAEHSSPMPVTILALQGSGTVTLGPAADGKKVALDPTHMVYVAPGVPHAVQPAAGTDLVLLVHHVKVPGAPTGGPHGPRGAGGGAR